MLRTLLSSLNALLFQGHTLRLLKYNMPPKCSEKSKAEGLTDKSTDKSTDCLIHKLHDTRVTCGMIDDGIYIALTYMSRESDIWIDWTDWRRLAYAHYLHKATSVGTW
jgi:hypothetical protein